MRVELDLFSGRENPAWALPPEEADGVRRALDALPEVPDTALPPYDGLGYRGFLVRDPAAGRSLVVWRDVVVVRDSGGVRRVKADMGRSLERLLLRTARAHLEPALYEFARSQIEPTQSP
jgi:hypothetical protein